MIDRATKVLTTSEFTAEVGKRGARPAGRTSSVGFGYPYRPTMRDRESIPLRLATVGRQNETKGLETLIDAFAIVHAGRRDTSLTILGLVPSPLHERLLDRVAGLSFGDAVDFTGWLDDEEYNRRVDGVDIAIQLRTSTNGEVSAAAADCLGRGIPTIVSAVGPFSGVPNKVVVKIAPDASADKLAETVLMLISDSRRRAALSRASLRYARKHDFRVAARRLLDALS